MIAKYRFNVAGNLRAEKTFPLKIGAYFLDFVVENGVIIAVEVFKPIELKDIPKIEAAGKKMYGIIIPDESIKEIQAHLKLAEGLLSFFGLRSIDTEDYTVKWLPANDEERELLQLSEFTKSRLNPDDHNEVIPFDLIARPFIAGFCSQNYEVSLSFYRKGKNDMLVRDYIEAFYDFYFVLESLFGDGKTKNSQIEKKFIAAAELKHAINKTKRKVRLIQKLSSEIKKPFDYLNSSTHEIIKHLVLRRGFLHHHNSRHPEAWAPDKQKDFHLDAAFLMDVVHNIISNVVMTYIEDEKTMLIYTESYKSANQH